MKRTATDRPTISWALIVRNASKTLETTLKSIRALTPQAEIVVVDTMSSDDSPTIAQRYADIWVEYTGPKKTWTREMHAFDDAAAARNESFRLASGKWVGWIDADDELPGPEETHRLLSVNGYLVEGPKAEVKQIGEADLGDGEKVTTASFEDFLESVWAAGKIEGFYAPYLYRFKKGEDGKNGAADEWQIRERIVRSDAASRVAWRWVREAHEILVADDSTAHARMTLLSTLLFVHRKEWDDKEIQYAIDRHWAIVKKLYDDGRRDFYDLHYLANYAGAKEPALRGQFTQDYLDAAASPGERARAWAMRGKFLLSEGYFLETIEAFVAGTVCDPSLPDNYFGLAVAYGRADRWLKCAEAYAAGCAQPYVHPYALASPREHTIVNRVMGALAYWRAWRSGQVGADALENAVEMMKHACTAPGANAKTLDSAELGSWLHLFENELRGTKVVDAMALLHSHLVANDETAKAARLADLVPAHLEDRVEAQALRAFARKLGKHETDPKAYQEFYSSIGTDLMTSEEQIEQTNHLLRVQFVNAYLKLLREQVGRPLRVLEIGTWDGITLLQSMKELPDSQFVGIEASEKALARLQGRVLAKGWGERFRGVQGILSARTMQEAKGVEGSNRFDAIVFCEVIEHIVDPAEALDEIRWALDEQHGRLFVSTPWGAFDRGFPDELAKRDPRGHVHAYTPRKLYELLNGAGFRILEMNGQWAPHAEGNFGDTQVLMACVADEANTARLIRSGSPNFVAPAALWDWNATAVEKTGMGASEETIVYLARAFGRAGGMPQVFGPIPKTYSLDDCEVRDSVAYWPREQVQAINPFAPVVVSRAPSYAAALKAQLKQYGLDAPKRMFLWLQDNGYHDLNPATAADYEKIVVLSQFHREALVAQSGIELSKFKIIPNFILKEHFPDVPSKVPGQLPREAHRLIYCSSPDRGLLPLLRMWSEIRRRWPDATLGIYYGWEGAMKLASINPDWAKEYRKLRSEFTALRHQPGIQEFGRVNHTVIAHEMRRASVWAYPIIDGRASVETFCSNAVKARAAGCVPVTVPEAALKETATSPLTQFVEWVKGPQTDLYVQYPGELVAAPGLSGFQRSFIGAIGRAFEATEAQRDEMAREAIDTYELGKVLPLWQELLRG